MSPSEFAQRLAGILQDNLVSVTLYGPAAKLPESEWAQAGEAGEEFPILVVVKTLEADTYRRLAEGVGPWAEAGNPMPMIFSAERLAKSSDSFPVELLDMKESRNVLHGTDSILPLEVNRAHFQQELINNLKAELLRLRSHYLLDHGNTDNLGRSLIFSFSNMSLLLRSTLRLFMPITPSSYTRILESLKIHIPIDPEVFQQIRRLRAGKLELDAEAVDTLFFKYLREVEKLADGIDALKIRRAGGATYPPFKA